MKASLKNQAYFEIKRRILNCEFPPGTLLNEAFLCDLLSISRTPVRDAVSRLEQEYLIRIIPPKGIMVAPVSFEDIGSFFETLLYAQPLFIRYYGKDVPPQKLKELLDFFQNEHTHGTASEFTVKTMELFLLFTESSGNPYFLFLSRQLGNLAQRLAALFPLSPEQIGLLSGCCAALCQECLDKDWEKAAQSCEHGIRLYQDMITRAFLAAPQKSVSLKESAREKNNLKQQAYIIIRQKIIDCEYAPGTLLNENMLLEAVPGSRTPVRDAVGRLEQERLVTILPKKGILVSPLSARNLLHVYEARLLWEPFALSRYGNTLQGSFYLDYYRQFSQENLSRQNVSTYQADQALHSAFIEATGNPFIIRTYEQTYAENHRARILCGNTTARRLKESHEEHLLILLSCLEKDWDHAAGYMRSHLEASRDSVMQELIMNL